MISLVNYCGACLRNQNGIKNLLLADMPSTMSSFNLISVVNGYKAGEIIEVITFSGNPQASL